MNGGVKPPIRAQSAGWQSAGVTAAVVFCPAPFASASLRASPTGPAQADTARQTSATALHRIDSVMGLSSRADGQPTPGAPALPGCPAAGPGAILPPLIC